MGIKQLGGFQEAAEILTAIAGKPYSRQGIQQMWKRREANGFPDRHAYAINGKLRELLDIQEVADWYAFAEAARILSAYSGRLVNPAEVHRLWNGRTVNKFPDRVIIRGEIPRLGFTAASLRAWFQGSRPDEEEKGKMDANRTIWDAINTGRDPGKITGLSPAPETGGSFTVTMSDGTSWEVLLLPVIAKACHAPDAS